MLTDYYKLRMELANDRLNELRLNHGKCMNSYDKSILATQLFTEISAAMFKSNAETLE